MTVAVFVADVDSRDHFARARRAMIDSQLRVSGVNADAVLAAFERVAREEFVPASARDHAYIDRAVPLGDGQSLPAPLFHGLALTEAMPSADDDVLVVSTNGYLAALAGEMGARVKVIAPADVAKFKGKGDTTLILVDGAIEQWPEALTKALTADGRVVTGIVERGVTRLASGRKFDGAVILQPLSDSGIPVLAEFAAPKRWSF